jgi:hypothetical protein
MGKFDKANFLCYNLIKENTRRVMGDKFSLPDDLYQYQKLRRELRIL